MRASQRGTTLIELVVVLGLIAVIMVIAGGLVVAVISAYKRMAAESPGEEHVVAVERLRRDLFEAIAAEGIPDAWSGTALRLQRSTGEQVIWQMSGTTLERIVRSDAGELLSRHDMVRDVTSWRWRIPDWGVVDVVLRTSGNRRGTRGTRVALRGGGGGRW